MHTPTALVVGGASLALLVGLGTSSASASTDDPAAVTTVTGFQQQLADESKTSPAAATELQQFEDLSPSDQQKLVDYLDDPEVAEAFEHTAATGEALSIKDGDVQTTAKVEISRTPASAGLLSVRSLASTQQYNVTATYAPEQRILGVLITRLTQTFKYVTGNNVVLRTQSCTAAATNFNFTVQLDSKVSRYMLAGGRAECDIVWKGYIAYKAFGVEIDKLQKLVVSGPGIVSESLNNA
ncbi:hypothetical protein LK09_19240 [Microbacterium mangrovi]|uniref:Uncharacterized protein n=1 Tax=Microbacterium mangrovi TaxID=1348253 RepID=A0A0B2A113_9MICO|nr:hypothetical protein [Microbacterium mangrovi]KHK95507.1 hypothetical protein LK09_19240 [Microbacterium mangrovi]